MMAPEEDDWAAQYSSQHPQLPGWVDAAPSPVLASAEPISAPHPASLPGPAAAHGNHAGGGGSSAAGTVGGTTTAGGGAPHATPALFAPPLPHGGTLGSPISSYNSAAPGTPLSLTPTSPSLSFGAAPHKAVSPSLSCLCAPSQSQDNANTEGKNNSALLFNQCVKGVSKVRAGGGKAPSPRFGHTAVVRGDTMLVFGGRNTRCNNELWMYSFVEKTWTEAVAPKDAALPTARAGHTAVMMEDGYMLLFGGVAENPTTGQHSWWLNDLWAFDVQGKTWSQVLTKGGQVPAERKGHTAVTHRHSMFVFGGGQDDLSLTSDLWEFNHHTKKWVSRRYTGYRPLERMYHVSAVNGHNMIVFGGRSATKKVFLGDIFEISLTDFVCRPLVTSGTGPSERMCSTACCFNGVFAVFTGGGSTYLPDSYQLDLRKGVWSVIENASVGGRTRPTTVRWQNTLVTFGGCMAPGFVNDHDEVELLPRPLKNCVKQFLLDHHIPIDPTQLPRHVLEYLRE